MKRSFQWLSILCIIVVSFSNCKKEVAQSSEYPDRVIELDPAKAATLSEKLRATANVTVDEDLELSLWAVDTLVSDPIAISVAPDGRIFYTSATRQSNSEFDIRGHRNWMTASISFQTIEDRSEFLKKTFEADNDESKAHLKDLNEDGVLDWRDLTVEKEQIWFVEDKSGDGIADRAQLYLEDFNEEITDVANGIEYANGEVYVSVGPSIWKTKDTDGDGKADETEELSRGFAIHIGFSGHGMSGSMIGPDGRIWWGIGDIGMNVVDKEGKHWKYPNQGVICRSELDGSNFEVYSAGVRNTHEFVFDKYGNLISEDNDGDHQGERERLVYLINGSETGWRINWQFGKYTDPDNNSYKVWMDEKMHVPHWDGQAAYFLPPIMNYVNGPTGLAYNPGTALSEEWYEHFFIAEFRGTPARSPIHAFTLKPNGASFELDETKEVVSGLLPTGIDFGADGAMYFGDWIDGWGTKDYGRIWKLDVAEGKNSAIRKETQTLLQSDFSKKEKTELSQLLGHQDMRVRQQAQFQLAKMGKEGFDVLLAAAKQQENQLARVHGLWGMAQLARLENMDYAKEFVSFLLDRDAEIITQAAKMIGDVKYKGAESDLVGLLKHPSLRVKMLATEALGRTEAQTAVQPILDMLAANNDEDLWLRHAGMIALGRIGNDKLLIAQKDHESQAVRTAAVVALRRMKSEGIAEYLNDASEFVAAEAARGINDDYSIEGGLPALASTLKDTKFTGEPFLRRAINANLRVGKDENLQVLLDYANRSDAPAAMRGEAIAALSTWAKPSVFDRVDGRYRGEITREEAPLRAAVEPILANLLNDKEAAVQEAAAFATGKLGVKNNDAILLSLLKLSPSVGVRRQALDALNKTKGTSLEEALKIAFDDKSDEVRALALELLPESNIEENTAIELFKRIFKEGSMKEQQSALSSLGTMKSKEAIAVLNDMIDELAAGKAMPEIWLDITEAVDKVEDKELSDKLKTAYYDKLSKDDPIAEYRVALKGGSYWNGRTIFNSHEAAQCVRCHTIFEFGGNAGPGLAGVAERLTSEEMLESLIAPSEKYALGYEVVTLNLKDGKTISGIVQEEDETKITLKIGKEDLQLFAKADIEKRNSIPSSMPQMANILTKREIRDLMTFLQTLKLEH